MAHAHGDTPLSTLYTFYTGAGPNACETAFGQSNTTLESRTASFRILSSFHLV